AAVTGPVTLTDATGLTVGAVGGTAGIHSGGGDVTVNTGNTLAIGTGLGESITATGALVTLNPSAGGVTEAAGSTITGDTLLLTGAGAFVLAQNNAVASLSGYFSGSLDYKDIDDLTVDRHQPISAQKAILSGDTNADGTADGSGGAVTISADGTLIVARDVETTLGGGAVGGPTLTGAVVIGGPATLTEGDGEIALNGSPTGDVTIDSDTDVSVISSSRDIIIDARAFSTGGMPVELRADNNNDGDGGVWIRNGGHVDSTGAVVLEGADIFNEPGSPVSVQIDPGGMVDALTNVTIQPAAGAPAGADVILGGPVTAGGGVTVDSADRIVLGSDVSAGGTATFHDPVDLSAPSSVSGATINMNSTVGAGVHALTFSGNALNLASTVSGTGALAIEPMTPGAAVSVGDDGAAGGLLLPEATLGQLADGFSGITIGNSTAGIVEVNDAAGVTFTDPVTLGSAAGIQVNGGGLHGTGDASLTLEGPASFSANGTTEGQPIHVTGPAALAAPAVGLDTTVNANAGGSAVTFDAALDGTAPGAESLSVDGGSGGLVTFTGPVGAGIPLDTLTLANSGGATLASSLAAGTLDVQNTTGAVAVQGDTALSVGLTTIGMPYDLSFTGTTNSIAGGTVFRNTGVVTLGGGGTFAFPGGVDSATGISAPTRTDLDTAVSTVNAPIRLGPTQLLGASSLQSGTAIIRVASVDGAASDLAIQQGGTGAVTFGGTVNVGGLTTFASNYDVAFQGGTTVAADTNFLNTGALSLGLGGDTLTFAGGLDTTGGPTVTNLDGILQTTNTAMDLAPVTLVGDSALRSGLGPVNASTAAGAFTLDLQDGAATGPVVFSGAVNIGGMTTGAGNYDVSLLGPTTDVGGATNFLNTAAVTLGDGGDVLTFPGGLDTGNGPTTTNLNGTVLTTNTPLALGASALQGGSTLRSGSGAIEVESLAGPFALDLQDAAATGPATFTGDVNIAGLNTFGGAHDVALLGTTTQIAGATAFQNTGIVTFGNGGDTLTFPGGVDTSVSPSRTDVGGTVQTTNMPIAFGGTRLIGASTLDAGANTVNTFGIDGNANDLAVDAVTTTVAGGIVNVGDGAGPAIDVLSGNADFQGAITGNSGIAAQPGTVVDFANDVTLGNGDTGTTLPGTVNFGGTGTAPLDFEGFDGLAFGTLNFTTQSARLDSNAGDIGVTTLNPNSRDLTLASG
ncbi:hypothetical protein HQ560_00830, partial [bacterium]|nr:hypothetical protein [bacterium]